MLPVFGLFYKYCPLAQRRRAISSFVVPDYVSGRTVKNKTYPGKYVEIKLLDFILIPFVDNLKPSAYCFRKRISRHTATVKQLL